MKSFFLLDSIIKEERETFKYLVEKVKTFLTIVRTQ